MNEEIITLLPKKKKGIWKIVFSRFALMVLLLLLEIGFLVSIYHWFSAYFKVFTLVQAAFSSGMILYLFNSEMESSAKLTWLYLNLQESPDLPAVRGKPEAWDHFVETVASISSMLLKMEKRHMVLWIDSQSSRLVRNSVSDEQSLQEMLCGLLRTDTFLPKDFSPLLKENNLDETKGTCIEIDLQGNFARAKTPG